MPDAIVALGESRRVVGQLRFESDGRRQHSRFDYAYEWLKARDGFALSPGLPLREGGHFNSGREEKRSALTGCFADAAPDSWGRALMTRALGGGLSEFDYLTLIDDRTRQGALRFLGEDMEPLSDLAPPVPRMVELERLRAIAQDFERDSGQQGKDIRELAGIAGSLGGARPKANVEDNGHLWIAKFTSERDTRPVERVEVATLKLAAMCGLRAAKARIELRSSDSPVALISRFDRRGELRIPYISARTAIDKNDEEPGFYTDIAETIRQISSEPMEDLHELWRRIVFTVLVTNTDDHLKNHGFIYAGEGMWRLSPAFDINPSPSRRRTLETGIVQGGTFDASMDMAFDACVFFGLKPEDAKFQACRMADVIVRNWKNSLRDEGVSSDGLRIYADAFEHAETEKALNSDAARSAR